MRKTISLALAVASICTSLQAETFILRAPGDPNRVIHLDLEKAIRRALTLPSGSAPPQGAAPPLPLPQAAPSRPPREMREQWRQRLFDEMKDYCTQFPDDNACGPNALSGGAGR
jgi:hypothetical protein